MSRYLHFLPRCFMWFCLHISKPNTPNCEFDGIPVGLQCLQWDRHACTDLGLHRQFCTGVPYGRQAIQAEYRNSRRDLKQAATPPTRSAQFPRSVLLSVIQESCLQRGGWDPNPWPQEMGGWVGGEVGDRLTGFRCRGLSRRVLA